MSKSSSPQFVLILDDEPSVRTTLSRFLEKSGYRVRTARTVREALEFIGPHLQAAILDVILLSSGGRSGLDVLTAIREMPGGADIPVLVFTGFGLNPDVLKAIENRRADLMQKPVPLKIIAQWLQRRLKY